MVGISAERINKTSPYKVADAKDKGFVYFSTDYGINYRVGFEPTDLMTSVDAYQFYIINVNKKRSPRDPKLRSTIMEIVLDFFLSSETAMLYICETGDGKQTMRERLFRYWASGYMRYNQFMVTSGAVIDEDGVENYATLIIRYDNPMAEEALAEFHATLKMLREKPDR